MKFLRKFSDKHQGEGLNRSFYFDPIKAHGPGHLFDTSKRPAFVIFNGGIGSFSIAIIEVDPAKFKETKFTGCAQFKHDGKLYGYGFRWNGNPDASKHKDGYPVSTGPKWVPLPEMIVKALSLGDPRTLLNQDTEIKT